MNAPALATFTLTIAAGAEATITSSVLEGVYISALTDAATAVLRLGTSENLPIFKGFRSRLRSEVRGAKIRNAGSVSLTVTGYYWSGAEVDDLRLILDAATSVLAVTPRSAAGAQTVIQETWLSSGTVTTQTVLSAGTNVNGAYIKAGFTIMTDPTVPGSVGQMMNSTDAASFGGSFEGRIWVCPIDILVPAGKTIGVRYRGSVQYSGAFQAL